MAIMTKEEKLLSVKHIAIYLRISDAKKVRGKRISKEETLKVHKDRLIDYCERNGYTYETFEEIVSGGKQSLEEREQLDKLLNELDRFDAILVNEISRLAREMHIAGLIKQKLTSYDKLLLTPEFAYDLRTGDNALIFGINSSIAEHERSVIAKRIKNDKITMSRAGLNASGSVPLGYYRDPDERILKIDKNTAHIPATAFSLILRGYGANRIAQYFNDEGYKTAKGKCFSIRTIKDMLKCETYKGFTVYNDINKYTTRTSKGEEIEIREVTFTVREPNTHDPIVSPEIWNRVQEIREKRAERIGMKGREKPVSSFPPSKVKDLIYCVHCKRKVRIIFDEKRNHYMIRNCIDILPDGSKCPNCGFVVENLEAKLFEVIFSKEEELKKEIQELKFKKSADVGEDLQIKKAALDKKLEEIKEIGKKIIRAEAKAMMTAEDQELTQEVYSEMKKENAAEKAAIQKKLDKIKEALNQPSIETEIQKRLNVIFAIEKIKSETDNEKINNFLKQFINKIHYSRNMPEEIRKLGTKNPLRSKFEAKIKVDFIQI